VTITRAEIRAVDGVLVPRADAAFLVAVFDELIRQGKRNGATPSARLVEVRNALAAAARVGASTDRDEAPTVFNWGSTDVVDVGAAALALGIARDTVRWHHRKGHLQGYKVGRQLLLTIDSIEAMAARKREKDDVERRTGT
jgi:hypothetical protein